MEGRTGIFLLAVIGVAVYIMLSGGSSSNADGEKADDGKCQLTDDPLKFVQGLLGDAPSCLQGTGQYQQVFYTWTAGTISDASVPVPSPAAKEESATSYTDAQDRGLDVEHLDANGDRISLQRISVGELALIHYVFQDHDGTDTVRILDGESVLYTKDYP
jgi:hypothetical protein